jgi:hypothetical protein
MGDTSISAAVADIGSLMRHPRVNRRPWRQMRKSAPLAEIPRSDDMLLTRMNER